MQPYEIIEHTADIGIRAYGRTLKELFAHAAAGMFALIVSPAEVKSQKSLNVAVTGEGRDQLFIHWLRELLYLFDTQHFLGKTFQIKALGKTTLHAQVSGEILDHKRHHPDKEVKAVTYCDFSLTHGEDGLWSAQVIFDI